MTSKHKKIEPGCNTLAEIAAAYERAAEMVQSTAYTSNGDGRSLVQHPEDV